MVDGGGGALLPGLHDHHLHLMALAAQITSVDCGPTAVNSAEELQAVLRRSVGRQSDGWVRGIGYHESVAGHLDRALLDRMVPDAPVRIQHRGGAMWVLNSAALRLLEHGIVEGLEQTGAERDLERDSNGRSTGRLFRQDALLARLLPARPPDLGAVGRRLRDLGITGVTDATPDLSDGAAALLAEAASDGRLPIKVTVLGSTHPPAPLSVGPAKIMLRDHDLPNFDQFCGAVSAHRRARRPVAVHCVTRESLILTLAVLAEVGTEPGDRIEHGAVIPGDLVPTIRDLQLRVVTQPDFLRTRGDDYLRDVDRSDLECLYPFRSLLSAGIPTVASSDAPFGELDPWRVIASAVGRRSLRGAELQPPERVSASTALDGYLSPAGDPGVGTRRIAVGAEGDLTLLHVPLSVALTEPTSEAVRMTVVDGRS
ncbi:amidohydrolase family protein [Nocardioides sp. YIM 152315]|uniref:amidohydrolase family protein n=1 Tax=Nocardioides sp. YIM 152315 TaxID=3031760 RepID=UPI0023DC5346|nr:amidohydrolase family protein [Nocardioides sp. YIM 152315]